MIRVIVIEREYGCGGSEIAEKLATRLGWTLLDHALTEQIARLAKVKPEVCKKREERVDPLVYRLAKVFWRGSHQRTVQFEDADAFDTDRLVCLSQQAVEHAAETGQCVIVGRGAPYFLRERADTLTVFLFAPRDYKLRRILKDSKDAEEAEELVDAVDQDRVAFIKHYFGKDWPYRPFYDLMLNTAHGEDLTIDTILHLMEALNQKEASP